MKIIIMGTGPFAVPTSRRLLAEGHDIPLVVTRPLVDPRPKKVPPRPVFDWAREAAIEIFEPNSINEPEAVSHLGHYQPDLLFVCDYGQILSRDCLLVARLGGINLHGSLLPRHRGAAPVQWSLLCGDELAGVTVIHMTPRLDAGPALAVRKTPIEPDETATELEPRLAALGVPATLEAIGILENWDGSSAIGSLQDRSQVTKAPRFCKSDGALDFRLPAEYLVRLIKACQPWPSTFADLHWPQGKQVRILVRRARWIDSVDLFSPEDPPGSTLPATDEQIVKLVHLPSAPNSQPPWRACIAVKTGRGTLLIGRVQPAGKREMDAGEFLRGHPIQPACTFSLPTPPQSPLA